MPRGENGQKWVMSAWRGPSNWQMVAGPGIVQVLLDLPVVV
jgi:hypothetical protein